LRKGTWAEKGEDVSEDKPEGATHLQNEKPPDEEIEPEELLEVSVVAKMVGGAWTYNPPPWG
jgi:hypothetical protein